MREPNPKYQVEVGAKLIVRLDNGDEHEATDEDIERFGLIDSLVAYMRARDWLEVVLFGGDEPVITSTHDLTDTPINPLRHLFEMAVHPRYPLPDDNTRDKVREMVRILLVAE